MFGIKFGFWVFNGKTDIIIIKWKSNWDLPKNILYSQATTITFYCPMDFKSFPLDSHNCVFKLGSYSYNDNVMPFKTKSFGMKSTKSAGSFSMQYDISKTILGLSNNSLWHRRGQPAVTISNWFWNSRKLLHGGVRSEHLQKGDTLHNFLLSAYRWHLTRLTKSILPAQVCSSASPG